jgi:hypothetical protein
LSSFDPGLALSCGVIRYGRRAYAESPTRYHPLARKKAGDKLCRYADFDNGTPETIAMKRVAGGRRVANENSADTLDKGYLFSKNDF